MTIARLGLVGCALLWSGLAASAATVTEEVTINAAVEKVWEMSGSDFCAIATFHPAIESCLATYAEKTRTLTLNDGKTITEKQTGEEPGKSYSYEIIESPLPVRAYKSTFSIKGEGGSSTVTWTGTFEPKGDEGAAKKAIQEIYVSGLQALKKRSEAPAPTPRTGPGPAPGPGDPDAGPGARTPLP